MRDIFFPLIRNRWAAFLHEICWVPLSLFLAFWLRFNLGNIPVENLEGMKWMIILAGVIHIPLFWIFGIHRGIWRFTSTSDLIRVFKTISLGVLLTGLAIFILQRAEGVPRSVFLLYPVIMFLGLTIPRISFRLIATHKLSLSQVGAERALIVGTGKPAEILLRNILQNDLYLPVALVDEDSRMVGMEIHGVRVSGGVEAIPRIIERKEIDIVILAMVKPDPQVLNRIVKICVDNQVACRTITSRYDANTSVARESSLRPVTIEDLLCREPVDFKREAVGAFIKGKNALVTGGGGSIGSELTCQIARNQPDTLVVVERSELNLFNIENEIRYRYPQVKFIPILGDVRDPVQMESVFREYRPHVVYHAAAYKHVPILERHPAQGVLNNVKGTVNIADLADQMKCDAFVLISTDKAVNPTNVMGATKRVAEIYCQNLNARSSTKFITTRFGNVIGSAGSVVPFFEKQIDNGGPVTVTHKEVTRYFMTIPEAVNLIMVAATMGEGGEIFVLDMGEPIKILEVAEQMIRLKGLEPHKDIPIIFIGLRPGEKLFEELLHEHEGLIGTNHPKLLLAAHRQFDWERLKSEINHLTSLNRNDIKTVIEDLKQIVPEFSTPQIQTAQEREAPPKLTLVKK